MASKLTLIDISSGFKGTDINTNFTSIEDEFDNTLSRTGKSPNQMETRIDMNSFTIDNLGVPTTNNQAARLKDVLDQTTEDATSKPATAITIEDSAGKYTSDNVEGALAEVANQSVTGLTKVNLYADLTALSTSGHVDNDVWQVLGASTVGDGKGGLFRWEADDKSTEVTNDSAGGLWLAPDGETGSQGAYKRISIEGLQQLNNCSAMQSQYVWPGVATTFKQNGLDSANVSYAFETNAADGSRDAFLITNRMLQGSPGVSTTQYAFKAASVTESSQDGSNIVEVFGGQFECVIASGLTDGQAEGSASVVRHADNTSDGKLVGHEVVIENKGSDPGAAADSDPKIKKALAINSDGSVPIFSAIDIRGGLNEGHHNGIFIQDNKIKTRAFWYRNNAVIDKEGRAAFGIDSTENADLRVYENGAKSVIRFGSDLTTGTTSRLEFTGKNSVGSEEPYAIIATDINDNTDGAEDGALRLLTLRNGVEETSIVIGDGIQVGDPVGGSAGPGTLTAENKLVVDRSSSVGSGLIQLGSDSAIGEVGKFQIFGHNSNLTDIVYGTMNGRVVDNTAGSEDGELNLQVQSNSAILKGLSLRGDSPSDPVRLRVGGAIKQVTEGATDSGGTGFRLLRVPN